jgi:hypothetical protein
MLRKRPWLFNRGQSGRRAVERHCPVSEIQPDRFETQVGRRQEEVAVEADEQLRPVVGFARHADGFPAALEHAPGAAADSFSC